MLREPRCIWAARRRPRHQFRLLHAQKLTGSLAAGDAGGGGAQGGRHGARVLWRECAGGWEVLLPVAGLAVCRWAGGKVKMGEGGGGRAGFMPAWGRAHAVLRCTLWPGGGSAACRCQHVSRSLKWVQQVCA